MLKHVLVTLDGSELAEVALDYARRVVGPNARITLLSVVDVPEMQVYTLYEVPMVTQPGSYDRFIHHVKDSAQQYLETTRANLERDGYLVDVLIEMGEPASVIVDKARSLNVDAIIMSTHGRSGISRWLFGSITQKVLNVMPCAVLVVPGKQHAPTSEAVTETPELVPA